MKGEHSIRENSIVVLRDDNLPPLKWKLGRVISIHAGEDGVIRTVKVKTASGIYTRNVSKFDPLPTEGDPEGGQA